jgi:hypothetical protein
MAAKTREESEEAVLKGVREWLPQLGSVATTITITALDPAQNEEGAYFNIAREPVHVFACRRGS